MRTQQAIEAENARILYFAMTPLRLLRDIMAVVGLGGMIVGFIFINTFGWTVDLGDRSERAREAVVTDLSNDIYADGYAHRQWIDIAVNFVNRAGGPYSDEGDPQPSWQSPDHFWVTIRSQYMDDPGYFIEEKGAGWEHYATLSPFVLTTSKADMPLYGFPYCHLGEAAIFDTSPGSWSDRGDPKYLVDRKSGRIRRDYETAAIMVSALRSALAHLKAGQSLASEYGPASGKPLQNSYCNADGADPTVLSPAQMAAYRAATYQIHLNDAPSVRFRYVYAFEDESRWDESGMRIVGMCTTDDTWYCLGDESGLMPSVTYVGDLLDKDPPLSPTQMDAERVLLETATWGFWVREARENGITQIAPLKTEFAAAQQDLRAIFTTKSNN